MNNYHGSHKSRSYFEGWYFKHQSEENALAFIPGVNIDDQGKQEAFIQVITRGSSFHIAYPYSSFKVCKHRLAVRIENNIFTEKGVKIDIHNSEINCSGTIKYTPLAPLESDIMGPFRFIPFMECNHGIISMKHGLTGSIVLNGEKIDMSQGTGYIEKDWGTSFPTSYTWIQCNRFTGSACSVMVSIATIPLAGLHFQGCIGVVHFQGREYRFATYSGVQIVRCSETGFILKQGELLLEVDILSNSSQQLFAPKSGVMSRVIRENTSCRARFRLYVGSGMLFDLCSDEAGYEYVK